MEIQTSDQLKARKCEPCEGGVDPCSLSFTQEQLGKIPGWELGDDQKSIFKKWTFSNFVQSLDFCNRVGAIAEEDQHHPDLHLTGYRNVRVDLTTHAIGGLSENDFILAAKINQAEAS
jgi:4a-hydroxytetrahydrobiopterin dehydratase